MVVFSVEQRPSGAKTRVWLLSARLKGAPCYKAILRQDKRIQTFLLQESIAGAGGCSPWLMQLKDILLSADNNRVGHSHGPQERGDGRRRGNSRRGSRNSGGPDRLGEPPHAALSPGRLEGAAACQQ